MSAEAITTETVSPQERGLLASHQIIVRPLVTEKGMHRSSRYNAYAFEVNKLATKAEIRKAVEELFNVKVLRVHVQNRKGKPRRSKFRNGRTQDWKKAIVKLDPEHKIDFF
jgi:large subunit ribosomal protein L23